MTNSELEDHLYEQTFCDYLASRVLLNDNTSISGVITHARSLDIKQGVLSQYLIKGPKVSG